MAKKGKQFDHSKYERWIDPNDVIPYEKNAKKHDDRQVRNIANSIKRFGWQQDVVITSDKVLVIGHGRRLAALMLGCEMPYHMIDKTADQLTEADIQELRIVDNKTNESPWDFGLLVDDTKGLTFDGFDFGFGFGNGEWQPVQEQEQQEAWMPPVNDEGFADYQSPLSSEELAQYEQDADGFLMKRRVIITFMPEQEDAVRNLLGVDGEEKMKILYDISDLIGG